MTYEEEKDAAEKVRRRQIEDKKYSQPECEKETRNEKDSEGKEGEW